MVISAPNGYAPPLAESIDTVNHPLVLGTIAGENIVLIIAREGVKGSSLRDVLRNLTIGAAA